MLFEGFVPRMSSLIWEVFYAILCIMKYQTLVSQLNNWRRWLYWRYCIRYTYVHTNNLSGSRAEEGML